MFQGRLEQGQEGVEASLAPIQVEQSLDRLPRRPIRDQRRLVLRVLAEVALVHGDPYLPRVLGDLHVDDALEVLLLLLVAGPCHEKAQAHLFRAGLAQLGGSYADGVIMTQVVPLPTSRATAILRYQELLHRYAPGENPDFVSLESYVSARILIEALQRAGRDVTVEKVVDALETIRGLDLGIGVQVTFGPSEHQGSHKVWGTIIDAKGGFRPLELE